MGCSLILTLVLFISTVAANDPFEQAGRDIAELACRTFGLFCPPKHQPRTSTEINLASVQVGLTTKPIGYKFVLLASAAGTVSASEEGRIRRSALHELRGIAEGLQSKLDELHEVDLKSDADFPSQLSARSEKLKRDVEEVYLAATADFISGPGSRKEANVHRVLVLAVRPCAGDACAFAQLTSSAAKQRFAKLYEWAASKGWNSFDQPYAMNSSGSLDQVAVPLDKGRDNFRTADLHAAFSKAVKKSRETKAPLSYLAAELVGLSVEDIAHLADVFDVPAAAVHRAKSSSGASLRGISDELGRSRLRECVLLRGTFEPEKAGQCAGFKIDQNALAQCLAGNTCMPVFGDHVDIEVLLARPNWSIDAAAGSAILPRISIGKAGELVDLANRCQANSSDEAALCLLKEAMGKNPKSAQTMDCINSAGKNTASLASCAAIGLNDDQKRRIECFQNHSTDKKDATLCAMRDDLPPNAQKMIACANELQSASSVRDAMTCMHVGTGSREADCLINHRDSWAETARCIDGGEKFPKEAGYALDCAQGSNNLTNFGVCMVSKGASGEAQRIAACYAEAQGVPAAVAVCLASEHLTQDQRIVLECAAAANGAPHATAACAAGKMAAKEMMNCKGKNFGEGNCFGENNEIRKIFANAGVPIGPQSVLAKVINIQLQMSQLTAGPLLNAANKELPQLMNFAQRVGIVADPSNPGRMIVTGVAGPIIGGAVDDYCKHNWCPHL
ncbi:hypothetical protein IVB08_33680 [Bradyrhizobium sp. 173]|uniref:hypothetical protein n=1 Tax=Bradyrhizobium sp. 173 TaxID=2782644 RepID=UPI001FF76628|nr:hypothetical protein [Bradyrhizobium sp. 173]MCK1568813.1 hypothetical protein [Bradyrhizobium sp. 173]